MPLIGQVANIKIDAPKSVVLYNNGGNIFNFQTGQCKFSKHNHNQCQNDEFMEHRNHHKTQPQTPTILCGLDC